jgi:hypothetical protein
MSALDTVRRGQGQDAIESIWSTQDLAESALDWPVIHKASTNVLAAASALYALGNVLGANRLFAGKTVTGRR